METASNTAELRTYLDTGDIRGAGTWLVERHSHEVVSLCRSMVSDAVLAEDLAQEVFGRAFAGLSSFRGESTPRTWLLAIARNRCIDHLRSLKCDPWRNAPTGTRGDIDHQPDDQPLPSDLIARRDQVASALAQLSEGERALIVLRFRHGLEYQELADIFGLKEGTIRMRVSRAISRMRRALQPTMLGLEAPVIPQAASAPAASVPPPSDAAARAAAPAGFLNRMLRRKAHAESSEPAQEPHPLVAVLGLLDPGMTAILRQRLMESVESL